MTALSVTAVENLDDVRPAWDDLVDRCQSPCPFVRSWWIEGMGAGLGAKLRMPLVFDADELIGGIPLVRDRLERILPRLRSIEGSDYADLIALPGREAEVIAELGGWVRRQRAVIDIACTVPGSAVIELVPYPRWILSEEPSPYEQLPETYEAYLANLSSRWRANVRHANATRNDEDGPSDASMNVISMVHSHDLSISTCASGNIRSSRNSESA